MKRVLFAVLMPLLCIGCSPTRIVTVTTDPGYHHTMVTAPRTQQVTTTKVMATNYDISLHLDLQAIAAAFAQASSPREFEYLLNNPAYMLSNLDLNYDGYVDYLRVVEVMERFNHVYVIQAMLGANIYQDVATIVAEVPSFGSYRVVVIGDPYVYGPSYYIQPVYFERPNIFKYICKAGYSVWVSPYRWGYYPSHYKYVAPVYLNHYQAYVNTYMTNHHYCHEVHYTNVNFYTNINVVIKNVSRNDYGVQHADRSFAVRNANTYVHGSNNTRTVTNALDIRRNQEATKTTTTTSRNSGSTRSQDAQASRNVTTGSSVSRSQGSSTVRNGNSGTTTSPVVRNSSQSSGSGSTAGSSISRTQGSSASGSSTRPSSGSSYNSSNSGTTVRSSVRSSGSSSTSTTTRSSSGEESTVKRGSGSSSTRSSAATSSTSGSSSTRSGSASTGSSASSSTRANAAGTGTSGSSSSRSGAGSSSTRR